MVREALQHPVIRGVWKYGRDFYARQTRLGKVVTLYLAGSVAIAIVGSVIAIPIGLLVIIFGGGSTDRSGQVAPTAAAPAVATADTVQPSRDFWTEHTGLWDLTSQNVGFNTRYKIKAAKTGATECWFGVDANDGKEPHGDDLQYPGLMVQFEVQGPDDVRIPLQFGNHEVLVLHFDGKNITGREEGHELLHDKEFSVTGRVE